MKPYTDPNSTKYPDRTFYGGRWRTAEQIKHVRANVARYHSSEKGRLVKHRADARYQKSEKRKNSKDRFRQSEKGRAEVVRGNSRRIVIAGTYIGTELQFPAPREVVETTLRRSLAELRAKQAADKEAFNESIA